MRFMLLVKGDEDTEAGQLPSEELISAMTKFNEEMVNAGVMLAGDGLLPSSTGARVHFKGSERTVVDGPFTEAKELVAGFWMIQAKSLDEAIEWARRAPNPLEAEGVIEVRQVAEADDLGEGFTPELQEAEARIRRQAEANQ